MATTGQMSREEALAKIEELTDRIEDMDARFEAASTKRDHLQEQIYELQDENEQLRERVAELEARVDPNPASKDYDEKSRDDKVHEVRVAIARKATSNGGKAAYEYSEVLSLFDQHPSAGHAYKLMKLAADYDEGADESRYDGFRFDAHHDPQRLLVNLDAVNDEAVFHAVNNGDASEGGNRHDLPRGRPTALSLNSIRSSVVV